MKKYTRYKSVISGLIILGISTLLGGCSNSGTTENLSDDISKADIAPIVIDDPSNQEANKTGEILGFSLELLNGLQEDDQQQNILISPYSIITALAVTGNGADNETLAEMEATFGADMASLNEFLYAYNHYLSTNESCEVEGANSIWIKDDDGIAVQEEFLQINKNYYDVDIYKTVFDSQTVNDINNWVNKETDGKIDDMLKKIDEDVIMYLINALSFDAEWDVIYKEDQVREGEFTTAAGDVQVVDFLHSDESEYIEVNGGVGISKPYVDGEYSFVAILPDGDIQEFIMELHYEELLDAMENPSVESVITSIPKFSFEYEEELSEQLKEMGIETAFDSEAADFQQMVTSVNGNVYINKVLHKSYISVDEKGTEAGAATVVEVMEETAAYIEDFKEVKFDRPFLFMIVDNQFHLPIFMGVVESAL
ncbi:MAG: serpin family protein [Eubacteriales bacterium]